MDKIRPRSFAISDIHGCAKTFKALLEQIEFNKEDSLYLLGDYVDRGPDSKGVIDHILTLVSAGYKVKCLRGNHEQMMLEAYHNEKNLALWIRNGGTSTVESFQVDHINKIPVEYIEWLKTLSFYIKTEHFLFVHAGISFEKEAPLSKRYDMLWKRDWHHLIDIDWLGDLIIIHGHTTVSREEITHMLNNVNITPVIDIDNGCVFYKKEGKGSLCALDLNNLKLYFQTNIDLQIA